MHNTISINGRTITLHPGMRAAELKAHAGIGPNRVIVAQCPDGSMRIVSGQETLPSPKVISAPRFIYG
jgi:hypothetical protein